MKANIRTHKESRFHPKIFEDIRGIALGALFLSPLVAAGFGIIYGQDKELDNNNRAQTELQSLQRCERALGPLAGKTIQVTSIGKDIENACVIPKSHTNLQPNPEPGAATISNDKYFVEMPSAESLHSDQAKLRADAEDNNPMIPFQYAGVFFGITAGYVTMLTVSRDSMQ